MMSESIQHPALYLDLKAYEGESAKDIEAECRRLANLLSVAVWVDVEGEKRCFDPDVNAGESEAITSG